MSSAICLSKLLEETDCDIALINEHKLLTHNRSFLNCLNNSYISQTHYEPVANSYICGRGGVTVIYKKSLAYNIEPLNDGNERIVGLKVVGLGPKPYFIFSVYMPACNNIIAYREHILYLQEIYSSYSEIGHVILGGDMNASILGESRANQPKSRELLKFIRNQNIVAINNMTMCIGPSYTFIPTMTMLDYIFTDDITACQVKSCEILAEGTISSTSDHLPIFCCFDFQRTVIHQAVDVSNWTAWHKATPDQLQTYEPTVSESVQGLLNVNIQTQNDADLFVNELVKCLLKAASQTLPRKGFSKYTKPYWNDEIKELHKLERKARTEWIQADRPRDKENDLYTSYKRAKDLFRSSQRRASDEYINKSIKEMENAADCNLRLFWQLVKKKKSKPSDSCVEIIIEDQVLSSPDLVLGAFENYYKDVFTPKDDSKFDDNFKCEIESKFYDILTQSQEHNLVSTENDITETELDTILLKLKKCKAPGWDLVQNEHIKFGGLVLKKALVKLYSSLMQHEIIPYSWKRGLIIPIYKGHGKSRVSVESYRPVTLLPVLSKIYEKIIQSRITIHMETNHIVFPNRQQQGFQPMLSCVSTAFVVQEVIQYNIDNGSCTYAAFLDTKRAFDTVWHCALFVKLYELGIKGKLWRIIVEMYRNILSAVNINRKRSNWFPVLQGVRQGGVLSTFLFLVYLDDLLNELESSNKGSHIGFINCCCPTYADDMVVLANSPNALQFLMRIIYKYYYKYRLELHIIKSCVIVFGKLRAVLNKLIDIKFGNESLPQKKAVVHLGIQQEATRSTITRTCDICAKARNAFYAMADIGVYTGGLNAELSISLYRKVVLPIVTYGCEIWNDLKRNDNHELSKLQHHIVKKNTRF